MVRRTKDYVLQMNQMHTVTRQREQRGRGGGWWLGRVKFRVHVSDETGRQIVTAQKCSITSLINKFPNPNPSLNLNP